MIIKKISIGFLFFSCACFLIITLFFSSCFPAADETQTTSDTTSDQSIVIPAEYNSKNENNTKESESVEDLDSFLETKGFLEVLNSFYYPDSDIIKVEQEEIDGNLFYILIETTDNIEKVKEFYKDKKVQSIWSRAVIYEESSTDIEDEFLEEESSHIPTYKFTYNNNDKNKVVNVLIKGLEKSRTRIMIICWDLQ
ncbi:MAG: hypothetical protein PHG41_02830 [Actinomycetota bacterium]|nr:hypothetical protein [Actinomycetota bacterium]